MRNKHEKNVFNLTNYISITPATTDDDNASCGEVVKSVITFLKNHGSLLTLLVWPDISIHYYSERIAALKVSKSLESFKRNAKEDLILLETKLDIDLPQTTKLIQHILQLLPRKEIDSDDICADILQSGLDIRLRRVHSDFQTVEHVILPEILVYYLVHLDSKSLCSTNYREKMREINQGKMITPHHAMIMEDSTSADNKKIFRSRAGRKFTINISQSPWIEDGWEHALILSNDQIASRVMDQAGDIPKQQCLQYMQERKKN